MAESNGNNDTELESKLTKAVLKLEEIDKNLYRANYLWHRDNNQVFGGQIIGQALVAAGNTVASHLHVHSMHCYFLLKGDDHLPIIYQVEIMRDGKSFSERLVKARQNGEIIFTCMVSFHKLEVPAVTHQYVMPEVAAPETLPSYEDLLLECLSSGEVSGYQRDYIHKALAVDLAFYLKPIDKTNLGFFRSPEPRSPKLLFWIKLKGTISESKQNIHRCVAAYISDSFLLSTSILPVHRDKFYPAMMASLDHSLWFHSHFRADEWMLYECESPCLVGNRAMTLGRIWKRDGTLAVSVAQEGVVRFQSMI